MEHYYLYSIANKGYLIMKTSTTMKTGIKAPESISSSTGSEFSLSNTHTHLTFNISGFNVNSGQWKSTGHPIKPLILEQMFALTSTN